MFGELFRHIASREAHPASVGRSIVNTKMMNIVAFYNIAHEEISCLRNKNFSIGRQEMSEDHSMLLPHYFLQGNVKAPKVRVSTCY